MLSSKSDDGPLYGWAGSFTPVPEHYEILDYRGSAMSPESNITAGVYNMR